MLYAIVFGAMWGGLATFATRKNFTKVQAWIGGFLVAILLMFPVSIFFSFFESDGKSQEVVVSENVDTGLGLTYSQVFKGFDYFISEMKDSPLATGENRKIGQSNLNEALFSIEIIGELNNVNRASILVGLPNNNDAAVVSNLAAIMLFLKNTIPEWNKSIDWVTMAMKSGSTNLETIDYGNKTLSYHHHEALGMMTLSVQNKYHISNK